MSPNIILRVGEGFKLFKLFNDKKNNSLAFTLFLIFLFSKIVLLINDEMTTIDNAKLNIIIFEKDFFFFIMKKLIITDNATKKNNISKKSVRPLELKAKMKPATT